MHYLLKNKGILLLRIGLSFSFFYAAIASFINPIAWSGFFPLFLQQLLPGSILIYGFGGIEIIIALLILFMRRPFWPAIIASIALFGITVFNFKLLDIVFRDVSLIFMALSLAVLVKKNNIIYHE